MNKNPVFLPLAGGINYGVWYDRTVLLFIFVIPFFPMPKSALGVLAPVSVMLLTSWWAISVVARVRDLFWDQRFFLLISCFLLLILLDFINGIRFDALQEFRFVFGRITSLLIIILVASYLYANGIRGVSLIMMLLLFSASIVSVMIILEGFSIISTGFHSDHEYGRRLFGTRMPFRKSSGVPLSDGKLGTLLVPAFTLLLIRNLTKDFLKEKYRWVFLLIVGAAIIIMQSRSGWLGLFSGLAFLGMYYIVKSKYFSFYLLIFSVLLSVFYFSPIGESVLSGFIGEGVQARTVEGRFIGAQQALESSSSAFVIGQGHDTVFIENQIGRIHVIHNYFLDHLAANGIVGLLLIIFVYVVFLWAAIGRLLQAKYPQPSEFDYESVLLWLTTCWLSVFVEQNLYRGFYNEYVSIYMALALYVAWCLTPKRKQHMVV